MDAVVLAIDTTTEHGGVAIRAGGQTRAERAFHSTNGFGHLLFGEIDGALREAGVALSGISCFAAAAGPGSFTGVRVGVTAAKGLAESQGKPMATVSNLRALATFGSGPRRAVLLDARRGDVYAAVYDSSLQCVVEERVVKLPVWVEALSGDSYEFITSPGATFRESLAGTRFADMRWVEASTGLARAVAECAQHDLVAGLSLDAVTADANYVRRADAELMWRDIPR